MRNNYKAIWFLVGLCSKLQVVASLSITEIIVLLAAPLILVKDYDSIRRDGVGVFFFLSALMIFGCVVACIANGTPVSGAIRGLATTTIISCSIVVAHRLIRRDPNGFKWLLLGVAISMVLCTFVFQTAGEVGAYQQRTTSDIIARPTYLLSRVSPFVMLPVKGWYIHCPILYSCVAPIIVAVIAMTSTTSGRSAALTTLAAVGIVLIGGRKQRSMTRIARYFTSLIFASLVFIAAAYFIYSYSAANGLLGEQARTKYERQTRGEKGVMRLLVGGRGASFIGLLACRDKPITGWGPWALDTEGYTEEFISKYGTQEDVDELSRLQSANKIDYGSARIIPCHAYITEFWLWFGISGLIFCAYLVFVVLRFLKQDVFAVPQWYGWLACGIPALLWDIFFSPLNDRFGMSLFIVACLMARSARLGIFRLPDTMIEEIMKAERK